MRNERKDRCTHGSLPGLHPVSHRPHQPGRAVSRVNGIAALLGGAAILALAQAAPLQAQTTTTDQSQPPAAMIERPADQPGAEGTTDSDQAASDQAATPEASEPAPMEGQIVEQPEGTFQVSELIGATVVSAEGEKIGDVTDLLFSEDASLVGVVIGVGGFLGFGEKEIAVDADAAMRTTSASGEQQVVLNYTLEQLEQSPEFVSLDDQRQAEIDRAAQEQLMAERQKAEQAQQQPATTVPTQ